VHPDDFALRLDPVDLGDVEDVQTPLLADEQPPRVPLAEPQVGERRPKGDRLAPRGFRAENRLARSSDSARRSAVIVWTR
jgi:hypothetical protein